MAKKNHHPVSAEVENNPLCHDTYKLLRCYRDSTYSLMVAVRQVEIQFQLVGIFCNGDTGNFK